METDNATIISVETEATLVIKPEHSKLARQLKQSDSRLFAGLTDFEVEQAIAEIERAIAAKTANKAAA